MRPPPVRDNVSVPAELRNPVTGAHRPPGWPARAVLAGTALVAGLTVLSLALYPANLRAPGAHAAVAIAVVLLAVYLTLGLWALRRPGPGGVPGLWFGAAGALMWSIEIWAGGPAKLSNTDEKLAGALFAALAVLVTLAAGPFVAFRSRDAGAPGRAGLLAGLTSGVLLFSSATIMTLGTLHILATRTDYQQQFATSGQPNINTFLVGDILTAATAHLAINLILGLAGGGIGMLISRSRRGLPGRTAGGATRLPRAPTAGTCWSHPGRGLLAVLTALNGGDQVVQRLGAGANDKAGDQQIGPKRRLPGTVGAHGLHERDVQLGAQEAGQAGRHAPGDHGREPLAHLLVLLGRALVLVRAELRAEGLKETLDRMRQDEQAGQGAPLVADAVGA